MAETARVGLDKEGMIGLESYLGKTVRFPDDCDGTLAHTERWLAENGYSAQDLEWIRTHLAESDCEALLGAKLDAD
jgi:hypothetical protein